MTRFFDSMITEIKEVSTESVKQAKRILESGGVVAFPTETVYGLGAIGTNSEAVKKIYEIKGRPSDNPLIAHVHKDYDINKLVVVKEKYVYELIKRFTPGPLTMVFESKRVVCDEATCNGDTLAIRIPSHKGAQALLKAVDAPIVAPSANISKHTSPVTAKHVYNDLNGKLELILDGGKCSGGIESTVLDCTTYTPRILRAGLVTKEMIEQAVGRCEIAEHKATDKVKSPGVKYRHYRPKCDAVMFHRDELDKVLELYNSEEQNGKIPYIMCDEEIAQKFVGKNILNLGKTGEEVASNLYDKLLEGETKADIIIAVSFDREDGVYLGIMNRYKKACG